MKAEQCSVGGVYKSCHTVRGRGFTLCDTISRKFCVTELGGLTQLMADPIVFLLMEENGLWHAIVIW